MVWVGSVTHARAVVSEALPLSTLMPFVGNDDEGGEGGGGIVQAPSINFWSSWRLLPSQTERAGKQQPLASTTSSSAQPPISRHASLHSSSVSPQKRQPKLGFSRQLPPYRATALAPLALV